MRPFKKTSPYIFLVTAWLTLTLVSIKKPAHRPRFDTPVLDTKAHGLTRTVSPLLERILVCIAYKWNLHKMVYLESMLDIIDRYETNVTTLVVTDEAAKLNVVLRNWGYTDGFSCWQAPSANDSHPYSLVWAHKMAIEEATLKINYTSIVYMEDDTRLSWAALTSWALDTEVLEPLNLTRCFYRTELSPDTGHRVMLDWKQPVSIKSRGQPLDVTVANPLTFQSVTNRVANRSCGFIRIGLGPWVCVVHRHFLNPTQPFQGMWAATKKQLNAYMSSPYWRKESALAIKIPFGFGYPERSNSLNILVNVPAIYDSSCMVPFTYAQESKAHPALLPEAEVYHMRNGYSTNPGSSHGKLKVSDALQA
jgi:hypothetical protein